MLRSKKLFFAYIRKIELPPVCNRPHLAWPLPSPFVRTYYVGDPYSDMS